MLDIVAMLMYDLLTSYLENPHICVVRGLCVRLHLWALPVTIKREGKKNICFCCDWSTCCRCMWGETCDMEVMISLIDSVSSLPMFNAHVYIWHFKAEYLIMHLHVLLMLIFYHHLPHEVWNQIVMHQITLCISVNSKYITNGEQSCWCWCI